MSMTNRENCRVTKTCQRFSNKPRIAVAAIALFALGTIAGCQKPLNFARFRPQLPMIAARHADVQDPFLNALEEHQDAEQFAMSATAGDPFESAQHEEQLDFQPPLRSVEPLNGSSPDWQPRGEWRVARPGIARVPQ